ncbi:dUTP diphosphatase [Dermacoccus abyssi]|uniref:Deoxyuridine 5'-triphosphate nucleotidohydrolase n=1 Tax=Dermacoccus abyssi TaxID=322596 RepID=A0ABX5Z8P6_9MICO|nr:dUTP diphosphatase [Dermacoccus abyssi]
MDNAPSSDDDGHLTVPIRRLDPGLEVPTYAHAGDAGADLRARVGLTLAPGHRALVPTGTAVAIPEGYAGFVHPRSGLAARHGITIVNAPGVVDAGYRGEIQVNLVNTDSRESFTVSRGDRIAQLVVQRVEKATFVVVDDLDDSSRGAGGHGSTGGFAATQAGAEKETD